MVVAKREGRENRTKEGLCAGVKTSGKTNSTPGWASLQSTGPRGGGKRYKERSQIGPGAALLLAPFGLACSHASRMYFPLLSE